MTLLKGDLSIDGHVVFDFKAPIATSASIWETIKTIEDFDMMSQFYLNKMAYIDHHPIPFRNLLSRIQNNLIRQIIGCILPSLCYLNGYIK